MAVRVTAAARTDVGLRRENNEDRCEMSGTNPSVWWGVVCDGMGGVEGGEIASDIAATVFRSGMEKATQEGRIADSPDIAEILAHANDRILDRARRELSLTGMGTTLSAVVADLTHGQALIAQVGDSRVYRLRGGRLTRLTYDHSVAQDLVRAGRVTAAQALLLRDANALTRVIGMEDFPGPEVSVEKVRPRDMLLLCTDGLTNVLRDDEIGAILDVKDIERSAAKLVEAVKEKGAPDNVTVMVARVE